MLLKKWPDIARQAYEKANKAGCPLRIFFQDEARFGRINDPRRCWARAGIRPVVSKQIVREYTYAYGAFCPQDGASSHFILPSMDGYCMTYFLRHVRKEFPDDLYFDGYGWRTLPQRWSYGCAKKHDDSKASSLFTGTQPLRKYVGRYAGEVFWKYRVR